MLFWLHVWSYFAAFEYIIFARSLRVLPLYHCDFMIGNFFINIINK